MRLLRAVPVLCLGWLILTGPSRSVRAAPDAEADVALQAPAKNEKAPPPKEADKRTVAAPPATPAVEPTAPSLAPRQPPPELIGDAGGRAGRGRAGGVAAPGGAAALFIPAPA